MERTAEGGCATGLVDQPPSAGAVFRADPYERVSGIVLASPGGALANSEGRKPLGYRRRQFGLNKPWKGDGNSATPEVSVAPPGL